MALRLVRGIQRQPEKSTQQKSREEYLVACLNEEANDSKFSDWERNFISSLAKQVAEGRKLSDKQKEILERLWEK
jgi:predicted ATP-binding protein involved in virulence